MGSKLAIVFSVTILAGIHALAVQGANPTIIGPPDTPYVVAYSVSDLPVWKLVDKKGAESKEPVFDASVLIALIKAKLGEKAWGEDSSIEPFATSKSLVVEQSRDNHKLIAELLESLRPAK